MAPESALDPAGATPEPLAGRARRAIAWTAGFQLFRDLLQFGLMVVLVRLLPAEAYGQFGFVTTLIGFLALFSAREFIGHTLLVRDEARVHYQDHFTFGVVVQLGAFALANVLAVALRWVPAYAPVGPVLHVMSLLILIELPSHLRTKMLERALDWRRLRLLHGVALVTGAAVSIVLALTGWGVYALLLPTFLVPLVFAADLLIGERWRPTWAWSWERFRPSWRFGLARIGAAGFVSAAALVEGAWVAGAAGFAALGVFGRAVALAQLLCGRMAGLLATAVYPVLTRIAPESETYRTASALYLRAILWMAVPAAVLPAMLAGPIVDLLYGPAWAAARPLVPWALGAAALAAVVQTGYTLLLAHGRQDRCLRADALRFAGTVGAVAVLLPFGLDAYLLGLGAVHLASLALVLVWLVRARIVEVRALLDAFLPPLASGAAAAAALAGVRLLLPDDGGPVVTIALDAAVFGTVYLAALRLAFARPLMQLVAHLPQRRGISRVLWLPEAA